MPLILPPCTNACPVKTDVRGYLAAIARRDYSEAYRLIRASNPFPSVCAWVCPHPCEDVCRRDGVEAPLAIRDLKRFAVEAARADCREPVKAPDTGRKVAVLGAGPGGLTAAYDLARMGHRVVVYERQHAPGGHLLASLPTYRLPREVLEQDIKTILEAGVDVRTGFEAGKDIWLEDLRKEYDAVIVGTGLWGARTLKLPGFDSPAVMTALPFLKEANSGGRPSIGKQVIVIGGGDVAMDVARTALRLGASRVVAACLEPRDQMPAHLWEIEDALAEGIDLMPGFGPVEITLKDGAITGLKVQKVESVFDREGRFNPTYHPEIFETIPGDTVILAIGQAPDSLFLEECGVAAGPGGRPPVDGNGVIAGVPGVIFCGEIATGPGPAIAAVASGHRAAEAAGGYLGRREIKQAEKLLVIGPLPSEVAAKVPRHSRQEMPVLPPQERVTNFHPYELGIDERSAVREAGRCLSCGLGAVVSVDKCAACLTCRRVCPYGVPAVEARARVPVEGCQACGICAAACPAGAITMGVLDEKAVESALDFSGGPGSDSAIAVFVCRGILTGDLGLRGLKNITGLGRAGLVELPAASALRLEWILKAFEGGAGGVAVMACGEGRCHYADCESSLKGILARARDILEAAGMPSGRIVLHRPSPDQNSAALLADFAGGLSK